MTKVLTDPKYYTAIANAIRAKNGSTTTYMPSGMADAITALTTSSSGEPAVHTVTLKQTEHQTIAATINPSPVSGVSSSSGDRVLSLSTTTSSLLLSVMANTGYIAGNLIINGETQTTTSATVGFDKDYVISATDATAATAPAEYAYWASSAGPYLCVVSPTLSKIPERVLLSQDGTKHLAASVSTAALAVLKKLTPYATTNGDRWTTDVTVISSYGGYSFTLPSSEVRAVIWAASEADRDLVIASMGVGR